ncbi:MAG: FMN-binding protein [Verrucomicrobia bacterium]|jgi:Na+-translocating ferredoxin:NAD+ oxidoreductase RnfG subunit|nr:FMN-binding protein [Verrucomicrobiota bacterium]
MTSRFLLLVLLLALPTAGQAKENAAMSFAKEQFEIAPAVRSLSVTGRVAKACHEILGRDDTPRSIVYYVGTEGVLWVLSARGKHGPIEAGFIVAEGRILNARILADREQRGRPIRSKRYLRQYAGVRLNSRGRLNEKVDGLTGATISSRAVAKMARLALRLSTITGDDGKKTE